ncbi:MAG: lipoprotein-releasing ABC transporter permease subunit [Firmicutes bacterium]|nr:lipoprotein-releasing ABC transporter permease subunit [Bacillota bacterium]
MNLAFLLAKRFRRSREKSRYLSFISASSTIGIGLGCAILVILLSIMNGFQKALEQDFLAFVPHVEYTAVRGSLDNWQEIAEVAQQHPQVEAAAPAIVINAMVQQPGRFRGLQVRAIHPELETQVSDLQRFVSAADWQRFLQQEQGIILGRGLAAELNAAIGDELVIMIPQIDSGQNLRSPRRVRVQVSGFFSMSGERDFQQAFIHLAMGQQATNLAGEASSVRLKVTNVYAAPQVAREVAQNVREYAYIHDWTRTEGHLYRDIQLVRTVMYLVLILVLAVASFNIVSTLVMVVQEKRASIAILKTMGADRRLLLKTFVWQGSLNGVLGAIVGTLLGALISVTLPAALQWLERSFDFTVLPAELYFISSIPADLQLRDVLLVASVALLTSVLATLYPAWQAAAVEPAEALRGK